MGVGAGSAGASAVQPLRKQQHPTLKQQPKLPHSRQQEHQVQPQHWQQERQRPQTQQQQHELQQHQRQPQQQQHAPQEQQHQSHEQQRQPQEQQHAPQEQQHRPQEQQHRPQEQQHRPQEQQHQPQQERWHWHAQHRVSLSTTLSSIVALLPLLCVCVCCCCCTHLSTPPAVGSRPLGRRLPCAFQGSAGSASGEPQTTSHVASDYSVYLQRPPKRHPFDCSRLSVFPAVVLCPSSRAAAAAAPGAQVAAPAAATIQSHQVLLIDKARAIKTRAAVQQHAAPAAIATSVTSPSCWGSCAAAAAADQTPRRLLPLAAAAAADQTPRGLPIAAAAAADQGGRGLPRVAADCHGVSQMQVTSSPEHSRKGLYAAATAGAAPFSIAKAFSCPAAAAEPLAASLPETTGQPSAAFSATAAVTIASLTCAAADPRLIRRQSIDPWRGPSTLAAAAAAPCVQVSEGSKNPRCCLCVLLCASSVALQTSARGDGPQAFCVRRKRHNSNRRLQGSSSSSSSCGEERMHGRGNSRCTSPFPEDFCSEHCGASSSSSSSQCSVSYSRSSHDWRSRGCSNSSRRRVSSKQLGFLILCPGTRRKHLRWPVTRGGRRCSTSIASAASFGVSMRTNCCCSRNSCSSSYNASTNSRRTGDAGGAARRIVAAAEACGKCNLKIAYLFVGLPTAARTAGREVVAAAKEAAAGGTAAKVGPGESGEGALGEGEARRISKRKRRRYLQIGTVPAELLENVVAERKGKTPSARALRQMQRKPPRQPSGLLSLLETRFRCFNQPAFPAAAPVDPSDTTKAAAAAAAHVSAPTSAAAAAAAAAACPSSLAAAAWEASSLSDAAALRRAAEAIQEQRVRALAEATVTGWLGVPCGDAGWGRSDAVALAAAAEGAARAPQQPMPTGGWGRLRVCGGEQAGRRLLMPSQKEAVVRPMMAKVKEALFSILQQLGYFRPLTGTAAASSQQRVLDLFSGSGALAVESLSRGAAFAWLVDSSLDSCQAAAVNLRHCLMTEKSRVIRATVEEVLVSPQRFVPSLSRCLWLQQPHYMQQVQLLLEAQKQQTAQQHEAKDKCLSEGRRDQQFCEHERPRSFQQSSKQQRQRRETTLPSTRVTEQETERQIYTTEHKDASQVQQLADEILRIEAEEAAQSAFSLVFACPPYTEVVYKDLTQLLLRCCIIGDDALVVIEYPKEIGCLPRLIKDETSPAALVGLRNRLYGRTCLAVYAKQKLFGLSNPGAFFCGIATDSAYLPAASTDTQDITVIVDDIHSNAAEENNLASISCGERTSRTLCGGTDGRGKELGVHSLPTLADAGSGKEAVSKYGTVPTSEPTTNKLCGSGGEWRHTRYTSPSALSNTRWLCGEYDRNGKPPLDDNRAVVINLLPRTSRWYGREKGKEFVPLFMNKKQLLAEGWITRRRRTVSSSAKTKEDTADAAART